MGSAMPGTLYVVSTPIGDPDDITIRALRVLKTVSIIASEDPKATQSLLAHHHHATGTVTSYGPRNLDEKISLLLTHLGKGHDVALVSDCGTPVIFDPGCQLINEAHRAGIPVRSVPGPSALTAAIAISGYSGDALLFEGRVPPQGYSLKTFLATLRKERRTMVFFADATQISQLRLGRRTLTDDHAMGAFHAFLGEDRVPFVANALRHVSDWIPIIQKD